MDKAKAVEKGSVCIDKTTGEISLVEFLGMECEKKKRGVDKRRVFADKTFGNVSSVRLLGKDYKKIKLAEGGEDGGEFIGDKKSKGSKNAKIKAKLIKKFMPKKLRRKGKPNKQELEYNGDSRFMGDDKVEGCEEQEGHEDMKEEEQESENISVFSLDSEEKSEIQGLDIVSDHSEGSLTGGETPLVVENKGREGKEGDFGYLILLLIVLAGLFGGRLVALLLTITFCFLSKLIGTLRRLVKLCP